MRTWVARNAKLPFAIELLGIAIHVLADTFAHQGFSGVSSLNNRVRSDTIRTQVLKKILPQQGIVVM